jgi:hypothetical protein
MHIRTAPAFLASIVGTSLVLLPAAAQVAPAEGGALRHESASRKDTLPEGLVYTVFFGEVDAVERSAARLDSNGKHSAAVALREQLRQYTSLSAEQFDVFRTAALQCVTKLKEYDRRAQKLQQAQTPSSPAASGPLSLKLTEMRSRRTVAVAQAVAQVRETLGVEQFNAIDYRIRKHILAGIHNGRPRPASSGQRGHK